jgi:hypothetical protein
VDGVNGVVGQRMEARGLAAELGLIPGRVAGESAKHRPLPRVLPPRASASGGEVLPFLEYAVAGFVAGLREQISVVREQQWDAAWRSWVTERLPDHASPTHARRRQLVLALSAQREPVPMRDLAQLTPGVAAAYARKTAKTLARDRNALVEMGLVREEPGGWVANREVVLAFLSPRVPAR